jgi:uncharacterized protein (TIGR02145 family)
MTNRKKLIFSVLVLIFLAAGLFVSLNPTLASVVSQNYKKYKAKYKNKEDKASYFRMKELKKKNKKLYFQWKAVCDVHKYDTQKQFEKLSEKTQKMCNEYYTYRGYQNYIYYRNKHDRNDNNDDTATTETSFNCGTDTVEDADGNSYGTVLVNDQCWMASNMNVGVMLASAATEPTDNSITEKWCYNNDPAICATDGGLYNWNEAMQYVVTEGSRGICPVGWHIPTDAQWHSMAVYLTDPPNTCPTEEFACAAAGTKLKSAGSSGMNIPIAGYRNGDGSYGVRGTLLYLWSSTQDGVKAITRFMANGADIIARGSDNKSAYGYSIRCLKD